VLPSRDCTGLLHAIEYRCLNLWKLMVEETQPLKHLKLIHGGCKKHFGRASSATRIPPKGLFFSMLRVGVSPSGGGWVQSGGWRFIIKKNEVYASPAILVS